MVILSVDYGDTRTGVAVCDKNEILATPLCTIEEKYPPALAEKIAGLIAENRAELAVVGKPVNMDGSCGSRAEKCAEFAALLHEKCGVETVLFDERMTTMIAANSLNFTNTRGKKRKNVIDALSAQIILQDYLDARK